MNASLFPSLCCNSLLSIKVTIEHFNNRTEYCRVKKMYGENCAKWYDDILRDILLLFFVRQMTNDSICCRQNILSKTTKLLKSYFFFTYFKTVPSGFSTFIPTTSSFLFLCSSIKKTTTSFTLMLSFINVIIMKNQERRKI